MNTVFFITFLRCAIVLAPSTYKYNCALNLWLHTSLRTQNLVDCIQIHLSNLSILLMNFNTIFRKFNIDTLAENWIFVIDTFTEFPFFRAVLTNLFTDIDNFLTQFGVGAQLHFLLVKFICSINTDKSRILHSKVQVIRYTLWIAANIEHFLACGNCWRNWIHN